MSLILDCTLRDGGYYTQWNFPLDLIHTYFEGLELLPIDFIEIGYRNPIVSSYQGEFYFSPISTIEFIRNHCSKPLAVLLDAKSCSITEMLELVNPLIGKVEMIRIAADPFELDGLEEKLKGIKSLGFVTCLNLMYLSKWEEIPDFFNRIGSLSSHVDYLYMVDSYGSIIPDQLQRIISRVRKSCSTNLGFHGHNNLELAFANTLMAMDCGVDIVDSTVTGMGRGAGNLKTELLLTYLNSQKALPLNLDVLATVVSGFERLHSEYVWGTNLPYMVSGANSLPQKDVMEWVSRRFYSYNSIIQALSNQKVGAADNEVFPEFKPEKAPIIGLIVGGGSSVTQHKMAIITWLSQQNESIVLIHASSKNAAHFKNVLFPQYFCLVGNEGKRMEAVLNELGDTQEACVLPPFPRRMGTYVPEKMKSKTFQLSEIKFTNQLIDSHTVLALSTADKLGLDKIYLIGYDGYLGGSSTQIEKELTLENEQSFSRFIQYKNGQPLVSLTPTAYQNLFVKSVYSLL